MKKPVFTKLVSGRVTARFKPSLMLVPMLLTTTIPKNCPSGIITSNLRILKEGQSSALLKELPKVLIDRSVMRKMKGSVRQARLGREEFIEQQKWFVAEKCLPPRCLGSLGVR